MSDPEKPEPPTSPIKNQKCKKNLQKSPNEPNTSTNSKQTTSTHTKKLFNCHLCSASFQNLSDLDRHKSKAHINPKNPRNYKKKKTQNQKQINTENIQKNVKNDLFDALRECKEGEELQAVIQNLITDQDELYRAYRQIEMDLNFVLNGKYSNFKIHVFGSAVSGLALIGSDFDFYIEINDNIHSDVKRVIKEIYSEMTRSRLFNHIVPITQAKIPLIKCTHNSSEFPCDLNFSNCMGVYNSQFLKFVIGLDFRFHSMMIVIKYWAKCFDLSGTGKITNYCLILMIIFYLQTTEEPILPAVIKFQEKIPPFFIGHWNLAFNKDLPNKTENQKPITELIRGFFEYYENFKYLDDIICPSFGKVYKKGDFADEIPNDFIQYKKYLEKFPQALPLNLSTPVVVQDLFDLSHNVASCCSQMHLFKFTNQCKLASKIFKDYNDGKSSVLLMKLFSEALPPDMKKLSPYKGVITSTQCVDGNRFMICKLCPLEFETKIVRKFLKKDEILDSEVLMKWIELVIQFTIEMLENLFLVKLTPTAINEAGKKIMKGEGQEDIHNNKYIKHFQCKGEYDVWNRKHVKAVSATFLDEEEAISRKLYEKKTEPVQLNCMVLLKPSGNYDYIDLAFIDNNQTVKKSSMKNFINGFSSNVRNYLKGYFIKLKVSGD